VKKKTFAPAHVASEIAHVIRRVGPRPSPVRMLSLAAAPVPLGYGRREYGAGPHAFEKANAWDASTRVLRFRSKREMEEARQIALAADLDLAERAFAKAS